MHFVQFGLQTLEGILISSIEAMVVGLIIIVFLLLCCLFLYWDPMRGFNGPTTVWTIPYMDYSVKTIDGTEKLSNRIK